MREQQRNTDRCRYAEMHSWHAEIALVKSAEVC